MYQDMLDTIGFVEQADPDVGAAMRQELGRQRQNLELIASENIVSPGGYGGHGSRILTNKYAEGYPGKRYYGGCQYVDVVEDIARRSVPANCSAPNTPMCSPIPAPRRTLAVYFALLQPGDTVHGHEPGGRRPLDPWQSPVNLSGKYFHFVAYGVDAVTGRIDYDKLYEQAMQDAARK